MSRTSPSLGALQGAPSIPSSTIEGTWPLLAVQEGRLFRRETSDGRCLYVGLLALPKNTPAEVLVPARLNSQLWLDSAHAVDPYSRPDHIRRGDARGLGGLPEYMIGDIISNMSFGAYELPDMLELFLRKSALDHTDPDKVWMIAGGASARILKAAAQDGIYEIVADGSIALCDPSTFRGDAVNSMLRHPLWGPGGQYGLVTSMVPETYRHWVVQDRVRTAKQDPMFAAYLQKRQEHSLTEPQALFYTRQEQEARELMSAKVVRELLQEQSGENASTAKRTLPGSP